MHVKSSYLPFAPISWWAQIIDAELITFDKAEHFEKMSYRNKYRISGANNPIQLSIPLINGREQRSAMMNVQIFNGDKWQVQHWRTLVSVYKQTPYWEFYEESLRAIFDKPYTSLVEFNDDTFKCIAKHLKLKMSTDEIDQYTAEADSNTLDLRRLKATGNAEELNDFPHYYQLFEDRVGFLPNLSILDLLFSEGPHAASWIRLNKDSLSKLF